MDTIQAIYKRKSIRHFQDTEIDTAVFQKILLAGIQAPSPKNDQPWRFFVVKDKIKQNKISDILEVQLERIKEKNAIDGIYRADVISALESSRVLREASELVFVCLDTSVYEVHDDHVEWPLYAKDAECTHIMSVGAAIQNMLLAATELGVDSLWIGDIFYAYNQLKMYLGIKECILAALAFGYHSVPEMTYKSQRKSFHEIVEFF